MHPDVFGIGLGGLAQLGEGAVDVAAPQQGDRQVAVRFVAFRVGLDRLAVETARLGEPGVDQRAVAAPQESAGADRQGVHPLHQPVRGLDFSCALLLQPGRRLLLAPFLAQRHPQGVICRARPRLELQDLLEMLHRVAGVAPRHGGAAEAEAGGGGEGRAGLEERAEVALGGGWVAAL